MPGLLLASSNLSVVPSLGEATRGVLAGDGVSSPGCGLEQHSLVSRGLLLRAEGSIYEQRLIQWRARLCLLCL